jgi:putative ATP-dependent endonuclease of OLD family
MKLIGFSAKNYRSISTAYKLPLTDYTVIVGPNNEGKSNILKALGVALTLLSGAKIRRFKRIGTRLYSQRQVETFNYDWERDFPINIQASMPAGKSEFTCEFALTEGEFVEFKERTKVNLTTNLKVKVSIGRESEVKFDFLMKGKGKSALNKKRSEISAFINERLMLQYIPAIRTSEIAINIVDTLLATELSSLEDNPEFQEVIKIINKLQQPILSKIGKSLKESISSFIPDVKKISIKNRDVGSLISASCSVYVDDGIETDLKFKGDGVISLTAISLLQHFSKQGSLNKGLILLLEEPESHLHPKAIHNLKKVIAEISKSNQVIVTTHSPIIIERLQVKHNILVQNGKASPALNINEIRESLGITMSDNLSSARLVLLVEGEEDTILLRSWLESSSVKIKNALESASLIIDHLGGATNVGYKASLYKNNLCNVIAYVDNDESGRKGIEDAVKKGILKTNEYVVSFCRSMPNSEVEDLIDISAYRNEILDSYGVELNIAPFRVSTKQWSDRVKEVFRLNGKIWSEQLEGEIKNVVAKRAAELKLASLNTHKSSSIDSLVKALEKVLESGK